MKTGIHPEYHQVKVSCITCGTVHETGSTGTDHSVEVCSVCHPFWSGKARVLDSEGRVERFRRRYAGVKS
jgi:large subunit ribosomal protein L31